MLMLTVLAALAAGPTSFAHAQSTPPPGFNQITFLTIDGVELTRSPNVGVTPKVRLTGVVLGETVARTVELDILRTPNGNTFNEAEHARCERLLLLAMARPGAFRVTITTWIAVSGSDYISGCALSRAP